MKKAIGTVVGALVVVGAVVAGFLLYGPGGDPAYRLTTPRTVAGSYARDGGGHAGKGGRIFGDEAAGEKGRDVPGMRAEGNVTAKYRASGGRQLSLSGVYGELSDPGKGVDWLFGQLGDRLGTIGAKPRGKPRAFTPPGFDGDVLECQGFHIESQTPLTMSVCAWGDSSTLGSVSVLRLRGAESQAVPLKDAAALTAKVRADARTAAD